MLEREAGDEIYDAVVSYCEKNGKAIAFLAQWRGMGEREAGLKEHILGCLQKGLHHIPVDISMEGVLVGLVFDVLEGIHGKKRKMEEGGGEKRRKVERVIKVEGSEGDPKSYEYVVRAQYQLITFGTMNEKKNAEKKQLIGTYLRSHVELLQAMEGFQWHMEGETEVYSGVLCPFCKGDVLFTSGKEMWKLTSHVLKCSARPT